MATFNTGVTEVPIWKDSKQAFGTITEGAAVKYQSSGDADIVAVATTFTDAPIGVSCNAAASGDRISIIRQGRAVVAANPGSTVTQGAPAMVISGSTGQVAAWSFQSSGLGTWSIGQFDCASRTANSSGEMVGVAVNVYRIQP